MIEFAILTAKFLGFMYLALITVNSMIMCWSDYESNWKSQSTWEKAKEIGQTFLVLGLASATLAYIWTVF